MGAVVGLIAGLGAMLVLFAVTDRFGSGGVSGDAPGAGSRSRLQQLIDQSGIPRATVPSLVGACAAGALLVAVAALLVTAVPMALPLSKNWTDPVAVPAPGVVVATVAVKVTDCPKSEGFTEDVNAVVVLALLTTWLTAVLVLVTKFELPE